MKSNSLYLGVSALTLMVSAPVSAQDATTTSAESETSSIGLADIVVTARRREENVQTVPIAVTTFNNDSIKARGLNNSADLANFTPNVQFDTTSAFSGASSTFQGFIRGVGQDDFAINTDPGVGVYIDGVYIARTVGAVVDLLDVGSIEILKGPQGTLFGRNTIGGAVNVTTARPTAEFGGKGELTLGTDRQVYARGVINMPLSSSLFSSVAFSVKSRDGYQKRLPYSGPNAAAINAQTTSPANAFVVNGFTGSRGPGSEDNQTVRAKLLFDDGGPLTVQLSGDLFRARDGAPPVTILQAGDKFPGSLGSFFPDYDSRWVTGDKETTYGTGPSFSDINSGGATLMMTYKAADSLTVKSITAYRELKMASGLDQDGSPLVIDHTSFTQNSKAFSQELQLNGEYGPLNFTTGLYYFHENASETAKVPLGGIPGGAILLIASNNAQKVDSYAVFGEATYNITDQLAVNFGGRYTRDKKGIFIGQQNLADVGTGDPVADAIAYPRYPDTTFLSPAGLFSKTFSNTSFRGGINYKFTPEVFGYANYSQGYKSGGFSTRLTAPVPNSQRDSLSFSPEKANTIEVGLKSEFFDRKLRANLAVFSNKYNDIQVVVRDGISPLNKNGGKARIRGVELEVTALPVDGLRIDAGMGYLDAKYTSVLASAAPLTTASKFQNAPEWTFSGAATYTAQLGNAGKLDLTANVSHRSRVYNDTTTSNLLISQKPTTLLGAQIRYSAPGDDWSLALGGNDLTNEQPLVAGTYDTAIGYVPVIYNRGRELYARLAFNF